MQASEEQAGEMDDDGEATYFENFRSVRPQELAEGSVDDEADC